jgi:hypothetical protein
MQKYIRRAIIGGMVLAGAIVAGQSTGTVAGAVAASGGNTGQPSICFQTSCPTSPLTYAYNRVFVGTDNTLLKCPCITTAGTWGQLTSKCTIAPNTCGTLYCTAP